MRGTFRSVGLLLSVLCGCAQGALPPAPLHTLGRSPPGTPETVTFLLPGALSTSAVFGAAADWGDDRNLVVEYRLPGMQGEPVDPPLQIGRAADWVAEYSARYPDARINLLGFSTGAAIAIEAAGRIPDGDRVRVVAVSTAMPFPGAALAALRGGLQVVGSALSAQTLDRTAVWQEYYKTLLLGTGWRSAPERTARAESLLSRDKDRIVAPGKGLGRAQSGTLLTWSLSPQARSASATIFLVHGGRDPVFPLRSARRLAARLDAGLCVYQDAGHLLFQLEPGLVGRIEGFFFGTGTETPC